MFAGVVTMRASSPRVSSGPRNASCRRARTCESGRRIDVLTGRALGADRVQPALELPQDGFVRGVELRGGAVQGLSRGLPLAQIVQRPRGGDIVWSHLEDARNL